MDIFLYDIYLPPTRINSGPCNIVLNILFGRAGYSESRVLAATYVNILVLRTAREFIKQVLLCEIHICL